MNAIEAYRAYLGDTIAFPIDRLDRLGVPVWSVLGISGPHLGHGVGYGETAHDAERAALGEAVEDLAAQRWAAAAEPVALTIGEAVAACGVHPADLSPRLGADLSDDRRVLWVPARAWPGGGERLVPIEAVVTSAKEYGAREVEPLFPPITNGAGAGAGDDLARAVRHGLHELLQRDLNWSEFKALDSGRSVDARAVAPELVERMEAAGVRPLLKYSGEAFGVHAFHASAIDSDPDLPVLMRTATGEGADPDPAVAGRKALYELCSSRSRKRFFFGGPEALAVAPPAYAERFAGEEGTPLHELGVDLNARFDALLSDPGAVARVVERITRVAGTVPLPPASQLRDEELEVLVVEMTEPGDPASVAKVIVPGLEAEVLSHHRLGPRAFARLRERFGEVEVDDARLDALAAGFEPLYREPDRHAYQAPTRPA